MADRKLVTYEEPRNENGPHWTLEIDRSAAGRPGLLFTIRHDQVNGDFRELTIVVNDGNALLAPVLEWLNSGVVPSGRVR